jgi:hypothetical protein
MLFFHPFRAYLQRKVFAMHVIAIKRTKVCPLLMSLPLYLIMIRSKQVINVDRYNHKGKKKTLLLGYWNFSFVVKIRYFIIIVHSRRKA